MPDKARCEKMDPTQIQTHHVWSRCVQSIWLLGVDRQTGVDYGYRRHWMESLIEYLASVFAVDIGSYHLIANHS